jgi:hypothetical protein
MCSQCGHVAGTPTRKPETLQEVFADDNRQNGGLGLLVEKGETGVLQCDDGPNYRVRILDMKRPYGVLRYVVTATDGDGTTATVNAERVKLDNNPTS